MPTPGRYGTLKWGAPPPGIEDPDTGEVAGGPPTTALGTGVAAPMAGLEANYEKAEQASERQVRRYTTFPQDWPVIGGTSLPGFMMPKTLDQLAGLIAAGPEAKFIPEAERAATTYGWRLLEHALRPGVPAVVQGGVAALTGKPVVPAALEGAATGSIGGVQNWAAKKLIGREGSPYITQLFDRQTKEVGDVFTARMPNVFGGGLKTAAQLRDIFSESFENLPWLQSLRAKYGGTIPSNVWKNTLDSQREIFDKLSEFFRNPDNYTEGGRAVEPLKFQQWLLQNKAYIPVPKKMLDDLIMKVFRIPKGGTPSMVGFDVMAVSGKIGARLHYVPHGGQISPFTPIFHMGFGSPAKLVGHTPEMTPSTVKRLLFQYFGGRGVETMTDPDLPSDNNDTITYPSPAAAPESRPTPTVRR